MLAAAQSRPGVPVLACKHQGCVGCAHACQATLGSTALDHAHQGLPSRQGCSLQCARHPLWSPGPRLGPACPLWHEMPGLASHAPSHQMPACCKGTMSSWLIELGYHALLAPEDRHLQNCATQQWPDKRLLLAVLRDSRSRSIHGAGLILCTEGWPAHAARLAAALRPRHQKQACSHPDSLWRPKGFASSLALLPNIALKACTRLP